MIIKGLMKTTLLDYPEKVACTVFLGGCNFRCPYCHNADLVFNTHPDEVLTEEYILDFLKSRRGMLDGVCITGGEPLIYNDLEPFIRKIKDMGFLVKLDSNGSFPDKLKYFLESGLIDYVAMDIKNTKEKYYMTAGLKSLDTASTVERSVELLKYHNVPYEFRTTAVKEYHTKEDFLEIAQWIGGAERYFIQQFVESSNLIDGEGLHKIPTKEAEEIRDSIAKYFVRCELRGYEL